MEEEHYGLCAAVMMKFGRDICIRIAASYSSFYIKRNHEQDKHRCHPVCLCCSCSRAWRQEEFWRRREKNINTFSTKAYERALVALRTKWFHKKMRCDRKTFLRIAQLVCDRWERKLHHNVKHNAAKRVALTLIYLANGGSIDMSASLLGISKTHAVVYIHEILAILFKMKKEYIKMPTTAHEINETTEGFRSIAEFSDMVGAIDGTLIQITRPQEHEGWYYRKNYPAINMQAVLNHRRMFCSYSIRAGSTNDQSL